MNWTELKKFASEHGVNTQGKKKDEILAELKEMGIEIDENKETPKGYVKIKLINNDAEDNRESTYAAVINERVQIGMVIPFGKEVVVPEAIAKNLESIKMQKFVPVKTELGVSDKEMQVNKYTVVRL